MRIIVSYAADSGYMPDKTNGFKLLEPIGLVRIGLAAAVVVTASTTEEEKNDPDPVIAAAVIIVVATSAEAAVVIAASTAAGQKKDNPDPVTAEIVGLHPQLLADKSLMLSTP